ncbi:MAG TPA: [FeFe] hydrogenase H-cluster radical SAM maturase HydE [Verrucomicrobia bacterium]|nr:MAG: [FeFe] hydrogenase H-cluster radical SAM maturase HydE [Lentisphaerae bacterium GWF2_57_35]HBA85159.1 [FeFe] hydrogenase H-cluster radical SAM maturase HydE [Verrucomicrobiota bacterium]
MTHSFDKEFALRGLSATGQELSDLYREADSLRRQTMSDAVYIRGIIEFSNVCHNDCLYCGIRAGNRNVTRYVIPAEEIMATVRQMPGMGQTTVVLQSGESQAYSDQEFGQLIERIKTETSLAVTVSAGNRPRDVYRYWKECGMDRYLIRFETSDPKLFHYLHPDCLLSERLNCLHVLRELGVQAGSGFMIGVPGETLDILADNILLCRELELDMIGIGPFIPHPDTPLAEEKNAYASDSEMFFKALAVLRLFNPDAHIPATTAFDAVFPGKGRNLALQRGANVFMPNSTPAQYREHYQLYPGKPCIAETSDQCAHCVLARIRAIDRTIGTGPGHSIRQKSK